MLLVTVAPVLEAYLTVFVPDGEKDPLITKGVPEAVKVTVPELDDSVALELIVQAPFTV
jgi:hypothetical protein